jgi:hypothetical protein
MYTDVSEVLAVFTIKAMVMEAVGTSETSAKVYQTTRCYKPQDGHLQVRRRNDFKSRQLNASKLTEHASVNGPFFV